MCATPPIIHRLVAAHQAIHPREGQANQGCAEAIAGHALYEQKGYRAVGHFTIYVAH
jgi:hypothetical protein